MATGLGGRNVTHLRDLFAILQVPHRRGLGGDAVQPPPASGESSYSPTLPPLLSFPLRGDRSETQVPGRAGQRDSGADRDPPPVRSAAPSPGPARPGMPSTCQQARSRPRPAPPAASQLPRRGRRPPPSPRSEQLCRDRGLLQVLSAPPNLAPSLPQEPPFESAHAAPNLIGCGGRTRGAGGGAERARAAGGGAGEMEAGTGTRGSPGRSWDTGGGAAGGARGSDCDRPRSARSRALREGGAPRAARGLLGK